MVNLLGALAEIDQENEYFIFVSEENRKLYDLEQGNFHYVTCWASNERRNLRIATQQLQSPLLVKKYGLDVFNSPGNTAPLLLTCPSVLTIKTMHHLHFGKEIGWSRTWFRRAMVYASARRATLIIANSQSNRDDIVNSLGVPAERVVVIHEAVDRRCFRTDLPTAVMESYLGARGIKRPYILNVSSIWRYKNQVSLVRAYAQLVREQDIPHQLVLVGGSDQPDYAAEVRAAVSQSGLEERVCFTGFIPHSELAYLYCGATAFVYPSLFETFGLTLLEAMACGVPVICSDSSSLPEIAGGAALLVNPERAEDIAAAIWEIVSNQSLRYALVGKGFRRVGEFSWQKTAAETLDVYLRAGGKQASTLGRSYQSTHNATRSEAPSSAAGLPNSRTWQ